MTQPFSQFDMTREPIKALIFLYIWQEPMVSAVAEQQNR